MSFLKSRSACLLITLALTATTFAATKSYRVYCEYGHKKIFSGGISGSLNGCNLSSKQHDVKYHNGKKHAYCVIVYR